MLKVDLRGVQQVKLKVLAAEAATNVDDILDASGALMLNRIRTRFLAQTDTEGRIWVESKAAKRRKASGRGGGTLFDTGRLFHSISLGKGGKGVRRIFTSVEYARKHQDGLDSNVKREFLGFNLEDNNAVKSLIEFRIRSAIS